MRIHSVILGWVCSGFDQQQLVFRRSSLPVLEAPYLEPTCWTDWKVHLHNNNNLRLADITPRSTNISRTKDDSTHQLGFLAAFLPSSGRILSIIMVDLHCESNTLSTRHRPSSIAIAIHPSSSIHHQQHFVFCPWRVNTCRDVPGLFLQSQRQPLYFSHALPRVQPMK